MSCMSCYMAVIHQARIKSRSPDKLSSLPFLGANRVGLEKQASGGF